MLPEPGDFKKQMPEARHNQILRGAAQVVAEKGFHKATTKEIAKAAGVAEGTIYSYFDNKHDLLLAMVDLIAAQSLKYLITTEPPDDPREYLTMVIHDLLLLTQESGAYMAPIFAKTFTDVELRELFYHQVLIPIVSHIEQHIQNNMAVGRLYQMNPTIVAWSIIGGVVMNNALNLSGIDSKHETFSIDSLIEQLTSIFLDGLLVDESNREIRASQYGLIIHRRLPG